MSEKSFIDEEADKVARECDTLPVNRKAEVIKLALAHFGLACTMDSSLAKQALSVCQEDYYRERKDGQQSSS